MKKIIIYFIFLILFSSCKEKIEKSKHIQFPQKTIIVNQIIKSKTKIDNKTKFLNENKCETTPLIIFDSIIQNRKRIYGQDIFMFFADINPTCKSRIEYYELENKIVFKILKSEPEDFVLLLSGQTEETINYVLSIIENPINDNIILNEPLSVISDLNINDIKTKNRIIKSINIAIDN